MRFFKAGVGTAAILVLLLPLLSAPAAQASSFYYEIEGGVAQMRKSDPFFPGAPSTSETGLGLNFLVAHSFSGGEIPLEPQLGLQYRLATASANGGAANYAVHAPFVTARLQMSMIFASLGIAPVIWQRDSSSPGFDNFSRAPGAYSYVGEAGFLWAVTPLFSLGASASGQFVSTAGIVAPSPILSATAILRFYFGFSKSGGSASSRSSNEFKGWRYPFGNELRH